MLVLFCKIAESFFIKHGISIKKTEVEKGGVRSMRAKKNG